MIINTLDGKQIKAKIYTSLPCVRYASIELDYEDVRQIVIMDNPKALQQFMEAVLTKLVPKGGDA